MNYIIFNSEKARKHLLEKGFVYTVRKARKKNGYYSAYQTVGGKKFLGSVYLEFVSIVYKPEDLTKFVENSGFSDVEEWLSELKRFRCKLPAYLYKATLVSEKKIKR